jgi:hypothetical protein
MDYIEVHRGVQLDGIPSEIPLPAIVVPVNSCQSHSLLETAGHAIEIKADSADSPSLGVSGEEPIEIRLVVLPGYYPHVMLGGGRKDGLEAGFGF